MGDAYRFGIEEEYFLADKRTGWSPDGAVADRFRAAAVEAVDPAAHELLKGQVEVSSKPGTSAAGARETLRGLRRDLAMLAETTASSCSPRAAIRSARLGRRTRPTRSATRRFGRVPLRRVALLGRLRPAITDLRGRSFEIQPPAPGKASV